MKNFTPLENSILENLPIGVFRLNENGAFVYANDTLVKMLGYSSFDELSGTKPEIESLFDSNQSNFTDLLKAQDKLLNLHTQWKTKTGSYFPVRQSLVRVKEGKTTFYDGFLEPLYGLDFKPDQPLFLHTLLETIPYPIYYKDINGRFIGCNSHFENLICIKKEQLLGKSTIDIAVDKPALQSFLVDEGSLLSKQTTFEERELLDNTGSKRKFLFNRTVFNSADGKKGGIVGIYIDITEVKNIQSKLADTELRFKKVFENANDAILVFDPEKEIIIEANPKASELFGYSYEELIGSSLKSFTVDVPRGENIISLILQEGSYKNYETRYRRKDGSIITVFANASLLTLEGKPYILTINTDVSEIIQLIDRLRNSEELYRSLFDSSFDAVLLIENGQVLTANSRASKILKMKREDIVGTKFTELLFNTQDDPNRLLINLIETLEPGSAKTEVQCTFSAKDGKIVYAIANLNCFLLSSRKIIQLVFEDITSQKLTRTEIIKLSRAIEQSSNTVLITDTEGIIEYVNPHFVATSGYNFEEVIGKDVRTLTSGLQPLELYDEIWNRITQGGEWDGELLNRKKSGDTYWTRIHITPVKNEANEITNYLLISEDITEKKLKDEQLQKYTREIEVMLKEIHHRVKNNLQIILSLLRLQSENIHDTDALSRMRETENRIMSMALVHEMLYSSESYSEINFREYVSKITKNILTTLASTSIRIVNKVENITLPIDIAIPCGLIVNELITNSIKHAFKDTEGGLITIQMKLSAQNRIQFTYKDNGIGLPSNVDIKQPRTLGLQIITTLAQQIGSHHTFSSEKGFNFELIIPLNLYEKRL